MAQATITRSRTVGRRRRRLSAWLAAWSERRRQRREVDKMMSLIEIGRSTGARV